MLLKNLILGLFNAARGKHYTGQIREQHPRQSSGGDLEGLLREVSRLVAARELGAAVECCQACVDAYPGSAEAWLNLGNVLIDSWRVDDAVAAYRRALQLKPGSSVICSAVLFHSHYLTPVDPDLLFSSHRAYGEMMLGAAPRGHEKHAVTPDPGRRIRVGYVSANLSNHSVGYFVEPVIVHHDRRNFEIYCYYAHRLSDETTQRIRRHSDKWRDIYGKTDSDVARMIRDDGIDILVDLAGHSKDNRLGVFARRPAPVQMTWLGYPDTTGLAAMDVRITDAVADPAPRAEQLHTERLLRLDDVFLSYLPPADSPPVSTRDSARTQVVFSCFNSVAKLNEETIGLWAKILAAVPHARIVVKSATLDYPDTADRLREVFSRHGVDAGRVALHGWIKQRSSHLNLYGEVDIALDTFPYNGTTTTCEALWMGVPVVSLAGDVSMSRVGATILHCVGLDELVAESAEQYIDIVIALARDPARLAALHTDLRGRLLRSALLDHKHFTAGLERGYRQSWMAWCRAQRAAH